MNVSSPIANITRFGLSSFQREKLGIPLAKNRIREAQQKLKRASQFRAALDVLISSEIPFWVVKGIELSVRNYKDPLAREFGDLDILVPDKIRIGELRKFLLSKGWEDKFEEEWIEDLPRRNWYMDLRHHISMIDPVNNISVELHWQLDYRFLKLPETQLQKVLEKETRIMKVLNREINVLSPELEYVFLIAHGTRHGWSNFKWMVDLNHFPHSSLDQEKLDYWIDFFKLHKLLDIHQSLENYYFKQDINRIKEKKSFLVNFSIYRLEYKEYQLPVSFKSFFSYVYFDLLLVRSFSEVFKILDMSMIRSSDIYEVKLPCRFLYYGYRPIGSFLRLIKKQVIATKPK
jgi:hypothetical protein